jgi:hypothetical protein
LTGLIHYQALQSTFGTNAAVTTQSGFVADNTLTGATNNYGFRGSIASAAGRYNLYMDGTANNYSAGNFGIGTTTPAVALHVKQNGGSVNFEGTDQAYVQFYPRGNTTRYGWMGFGSAGTNNFTIRNDDIGRLALESGNSNVSVFANGNVTTTVAGVANVLVVTSTGANIAGTLSASGNITGNFFIGNGSQLTGITTATSLANGTSNVSIPAVNGNINLSSAGNANIVVVTGTGANITGTLNVSGNTTFSGTGQRILGDFSNGTLASRTVFQSSTANTATDIPILPNGTAAGGSSLNTFNLSNIANSAYVVMGANSTVTRLYSATTGTATLLPLAFGMGSSEAARIDTGLNFLVGRTSFSSVTSGVKGATVNTLGYISLETDYNTGGSLYINTFGAGSNATNQIYFYRNNTAAGLIVTNSSNQTSIVASSDYRLKNTITPLTTSGSFIDKLKPSSWIWNSSGVTDAGFIAHEAAEVTPNSVYGEKDAVDKDGNPVYQMMNASSSEIIANMVAELQDLRRRFAELQAEVNHLKNP